MRSWIVSVNKGFTDTEPLLDCVSLWWRQCGTA